MTQTTGDGSYEAVRDFVITEAAYQQAKDAYTAARKTLLNLAPKEVGEFTVTAGDFTATIKYPEKLKWDAEQLDALYGGDKPAYVKTAYKIDVTDLRKLPVAEQEQLKNCHEVVPGTPAIDIVKAAP